MDLTGMLLIAMPGMGDPRFDGTLILICVHTVEGAMGLILNRSKPALAFANLLTMIDVPQTPACRPVRVRTGGPVEPSCGFVLHGADYGTGEDTVNVAPGIRMTTSQDVLSALGAGAGPAEAVLMLGYAGWGAGQLEAEIARNDWLTAAVRHDLVFGVQDTGKWRAALGSIGVDPLALSSVAGRA